MYQHVDKYALARILFPKLALVSKHQELKYHNEKRGCGVRLMGIGTEKLTKKGEKWESKVNKRGVKLREREKVDT